MHLWRGLLKNHCLKLFSDSLENINYFGIFLIFHLKKCFLYIKIILYLKRTGPGQFFVSSSD